MANTPKTVTFDVSTTTEYDEVAAKYFRSGWVAALREVALHLEPERLGEFLEAQRRMMEEEK